jgi:hypothetical protein
MKLLLCGLALVAIAAFSFTVFAGEGPRDRPVEGALKVGDAAPDFTLKSPDGKASVTLSALNGPQPVVLVFASYTWGPFRLQAGAVEQCYQKYKDRAKFLLVYIREAHPSDGWQIPQNVRDGIEIAQPKTDDARAKVAVTCLEHLKLTLPCVVDGVDNRVGTAYAGWPDRFYIVGTDGKIICKSDPGPRGFSVPELTGKLDELLKK